MAGVVAGWEQLGGTSTNEPTLWLLQAAVDAQALIAGGLHHGYWVSLWLGAAQWRALALALATTCGPASSGAC